MRSCIRCASSPWATRPGRNYEATETAQDAAIKRVEATQVLATTLSASAYRLTRPGRNYGATEIAQDPAIKRVGQPAQYPSRVSVAQCARLQYLDTRDPAVDELMSLEAMGL